MQRQLRKLGVADDIYDAIVSSGDLTRAYIAERAGQSRVPDRPGARQLDLPRPRPGVRAARAGRLHRLHRAVRRRDRDRRKTIASMMNGRAPQADHGVRQSRHRGRARRPADLSAPARIAELYRDTRRRGDLLRQAASADLRARSGAGDASAAARATPLEAGCWRSAIRSAPISPAPSDFGLDCLFVTRGIHAGEFEGSTGSIPPRSRNCSATRRWH